MSSPNSSSKKSYDYRTTQSLWAAVRENDARQVEKLLSQGADPNARGTKTSSGRAHIASYAVDHSADRALAVLLSRGSRQVAGQDGNTPLHLAASKPQTALPCMRVLLGRKPNVHALNNKSQTPLSIALAGNASVFEFSPLSDPDALAAIRLLMSASASRKWTAAASTSAFLRAVRRHPPCLWEELVDQGASVKDAAEKGVFTVASQEMFKLSSQDDGYARANLDPLWDFMHRHGVQWDEEADQAALPVQAAYRAYSLSQTLAAPAPSLRKPRF